MEPMPAATHRPPASHPASRYLVIREPKGLRLCTFLTNLGSQLEPQIEFMDRVGAFNSTWDFGMLIFQLTDIFFVLKPFQPEGRGPAKIDALEDDVLVVVNISG